MRWARNMWFAVIGIRLYTEREILGAHRASDELECRGMAWGYYRARTLAGLDAVRSGHKPQAPPV